MKQEMLILHNGTRWKKGGNVLAYIFTKKLKKVIFFKNISICCKIVF